MKRLGYTYWQEQTHWLGYLDEYPDYLTQGNTENELKENLLDIYKDLSSGAIPCARRHSELEIA
jgi:hypothetical protein